MQIIRHLEDVTPDLRGGVFAVGNFDGVHGGHRAVIALAARDARAQGVHLGVLVFEPHPRRYFNPEGPFFRLTPFRARARILRCLGVNILAALPFNAQMAQRSAADFAAGVLVAGLGVRHVAVGHDFVFGAGRSGAAADLCRLGAAQGFGVSVAETATHVNEAYSSTRIRKALAQGSPRTAAELLGRWWAVEGRVRIGDRRGRTLGFPTANITLGEHLQPALGVYAVRVRVRDGPRAGRYDGVANIGRRPTFDQRDVVLEAHLFDFDGDLYGARVNVALTGFLRAERKFDGLQSLRAQIAADCASAREHLAALPGEAALFGPFVLPS